MFPLSLMTIMDDDDRNYMITIYERYQWLMIAIARRYVQTSYDQEEIISEACLALIKKIPTLQTLDGVYMRSSQNSQPNSDTPDMNSGKKR